MRLTKRQVTFALFLILWIGFFLRVFRIEDQSYWWDEGISLHLATSTWSEILVDRLNNIHPPLYFFILKSWVNLTGLTPFATRMSSALVSFLQIGAVFVVSLRFFKSQRIALLSALLIALSPLSIIYGQEVRVYAFLPLVFFGLIGTMQLLIQHNDGGERNVWGAFGFIVWFGLHLHYIAAFMVLFVSLWGMSAFAMQRAWGKVRAIFVTATAVSIASLPWFGSLAYNLITISRPANGRTFLAEPVPLEFLVKQIGLFHFTGLAGALNFDWLLWTGTAVSLLVSILLLFRLIQAGLSRRRFILWLTIWFIPLFSALIVWSVRSFSHPRYISMFAMGLFPLLASLVLTYEPIKSVVFRTLSAGLGAGLLTAVITISSIALYLYFFDPNVQKDDMRSVARYLETAVSDSDLIIIPDTDYSLPFEYQGDASIVMLDTPNREALFENVTTLTSDHSTIFFIDYEQDTKDWQDFTTFALNNGGVLVNQIQFEDILVKEFAIESSFQPLSEILHQVPIIIDGDLQLYSAQIEVDSNKSGAVSIALGWDLGAVIPHRLKGTLRLKDVDGREVSKETVLFIDLIGRPSDLWAFEDTFFTYHTLPLPLGVPPLNYEVTLDLFIEKEDGSLTYFDFLATSPQREWVLGQAELKNFPNQSFEPLSPIPFFDEPLSFEQPLSLLGASVDRDSLFGGQTAFVPLMWRAEQGSLPIIEPQIQLVQNDRFIPISSPTLLNRYPTSEWQAQELVFEVRQIQAPSEISGEFDVVITVGDDTHTIGTIEILETDRVFSKPEVQIPLEHTFGETAVLIGLDLPQTEFRPSDAIPLTLHWQSITEGETNPYKLFVHLLDENDNIIGQVDVEPLGGIRPFTSWIQGEYISDMLNITLNDSNFEGEVRIGVGIYNPVDNTRLLDMDGNGRVILPTSLSIQN